MKKLCWADEDIPQWLIEKCQEGVRKAVGRELRRLQKGERPLAYRMLPSFGVHVGELKRGRLRVAYTTELQEFVAVACAFNKDAKQGDGMRPEHTRLINRGLTRIRQGLFGEDSGLLGKYLH